MPYKLHLYLNSPHSNLFLPNRPGPLSSDTQAAIRLAAGDNRALELAVRYNRIDIVKKLLEFQEVVKNITVNNNYILREAYAAGHIDVCHLHLDFPEVQASE